MPKKDSQRSKVYAAEQDYLRPGHAKYIGDIYECQQFVNRVLARQYVRKHYSSYQKIIVKGVPKKYRWAHASPTRRVIEVGTGEASKWARTDAVLLHEIAHVLAYDKHHVCSHGWGFAAVFLDLVRNVMGKPAHDALKRGYRAKKVRFREPKKRQKPVLTDEQKAAQVERLAQARMKREAELAPKRAAKERAIKLHTKTRSNKRAFGKQCHTHWLGNRSDGLDKVVWIEKDPRYMSHAEIEQALGEYDRKQRTAVDLFEIRVSNAIPGSTRKWLTST